MNSVLLEITPRDGGMYVSFIDGAIAGGGHVHFPLGLNYDVMKETILEAIQKAQEDK